MKNFRYILIALAFMILSCERMEIKPEPKVLAEFDAVAEKSNLTTKVSIDHDYILSWDQGDKIKVWDGTSELLFMAKAAGRSAIFQSEGVVLVNGKSYAAAYPESMSSFTDEGLKVFVSNTIVTDPAQLPQSPAVAKSNGQDRTLEFRNVCGLISFNVVGDDIVSITVEGAEQEVLAGWISVDPQTGEYDSATITEAASKIEISGLLSGLYSGKYYLPVLPQNFAKGLKITMHTMNGTDIVREFTTPFELKRSFYYDLESVDQGRYFRYEISDAKELQQFLDDAKDCEGHVVATLLRDIDLKGVELEPAESFKGTFNGNSKKLKNWDATSPLFKTLAQGAVVRNLTIASSCTYTLAETAEPQAFIVGENNGLVNGCTNEASVSYTLSQVETPVARSFGTIVGVCNGKMTDCINLGNIEVALSAQTGAQHIGGVVGTFNSATKAVAIENCTNQGNISVETQYPHYVNLGGVCAQGCNGTPVAESTAACVGSISGCVNKGEVTLIVSAPCEEETVNVGGVIGYVEGNIASCVNEATGKIVLKAGSSVGATLCAPSVGGVAGTVLSGYISGSSNAALISIEGAAKAASAVAAYTGGNVNPAVGGVVAKIGKASEDTAVNISDCTNTGAVTSALTGSAVINVGGIVGWTSVPAVGSAANKLLNKGTVTVASGSEMSEVNAGGVIGRSISTFDKIYNGETGTVTVNLPDTRNCTASVAGVAGYMEKAADNTFKQGHNRAAVNMNGGEMVTSTCFVAGIVAQTKATKVTSNSTSWDNSNSNYGDITVDSPVKLLVGGVLGRIGATTSGDGATARCKNRGNITVKSPKSGSCIGGVLGQHGRGKLGDANNCGVVEDPVTITVTDGALDVYVGGYVGQVKTNNGPYYPSCCTTISGFGIYGSISASGTTAGLIAGNVMMTGQSTTNGIMISSSGQNVRIAKDCKINDVKVGDLTKNPLSAFIATITPSSETTRTKDEAGLIPLKNTYYICAYGGTTEAEFPYGFTNY